MNRTDAWAEQGRDLRSQAFIIMSLFWLKPDEQAYAEVYAPTTLAELDRLSRAAYGIEGGWSDLIGCIPSFDEAVRFHDSALNTSFGVRAAGCVESLYKPWTEDPSCTLQGAREKNRLMGDSAYYMKDLLKRLQIEAPEGMMPDHLSVELGVYAVLVKSAPQEDVRDFAARHLDWLGDFGKRLEGVTDERFYVNVLSLTNRIIQAELTL